MSLYQVSVLKKHLKLQDQNQLNKAYKKYTKYFLNPTIQDNIRSSKEEEYQGIFLTELFVNVLDYTLKPKADFNLVAEYKNQNNARKADGAILNNDVAIGVIELKGTNTKDLESIRKQAFDYKANQKGCTYVITSNFEKLRFYINDATEFEEFNLFELPQERFELLYLCLQKDNVLNNIPLQIKEASIVVEAQITKQFYKDYSLFKRELYRDLVKRNAKQLKAQASLSLNTEDQQTEERQAELLRLEKNVKLTLFKKSQKLIDRFLFIFFAEDRGLLPPNSTQQILDKWKADVDFGDERPLYNLFKQYFKFLDQGRQGTTSRAEIYAYNGGLFKEDSLLDTLEIDNDLLHKYTQQLAAYDFESQVDVNILGHIFENSLNEIESVNAEIEGGDFDKQKSKRKKDGVFYTPKYITKYIVENTIGKLCDEKKMELNFKEEEYFKGRKNRNKDTITKLVAILDTYRDWLLQLTICDPACGSGAFLNQALDFLIKEHSYIDELKTKVLGGGLQFSDIENTILENNIYGVDLNEESVEIAKLSLWLRTAQPRRKLNSLTNNIKCGNSLIDSKAVAGDKAFNWHTQFPQVFKEKDKKAYHITTAIHDSRTSARMVKYKVRSRRDLGTNPYPNVIYFTPEDDLLITQTLADIVAEDQLNVLAYNICADHIHLLLVCHIDEIPSIMQKIKSVTANKVNKTRSTTTREHAPLSKNKNKNKPLWQQKYSAPKEVTTQAQLQNTIRYIQNNRSKHELPEHSKKLQNTISSLCTTPTQAFKTEYDGGFDVVIGNPPYVDIKALDPFLVKALFKKYKTTENRINLYSIFIEKGYDLIKKDGFLSFINPNSILVNSSYTKIRKFLIDDMTTIVKLPDGTFVDAVVETIIFEFRKGSNQENVDVILYPKSEIISFVDTNRIQIISKKEWKTNSSCNYNIYVNPSQLKILEKMNRDSSSLGEIADFTLGITPYDKYKGHSQELIKNREYHSISKIDENYKPLISGANITRYFVSEKIDEYINYGNWLGAPREERFFTDARIIIRQIVSGNPPRIYAGYTEKPLYFTQIGFSVIPKKDIVSVKSLLSIVNSKLINFYHKYSFLDLEKELFQKILIANCKKIPIKKLKNKEDKSFEVKTSGIISLITTNQVLADKFQNYLKQKFQLQKLSKKLQNWHELDFGDFIKELNKAIKANNKLRVKEGLEEVPTLTKKDEFEWLDLFEDNKQKAQALQTQITQTDKEIDAMVYELYGLTDEEIAIVENS